MEGKLASGLSGDTAGETAGEIASADTGSGVEKNGVGTDSITHQMKPSNPKEEPSQSKEQKSPNEEPTPSEEQNLPSDELTQAEKQNLSHDEPTSNDEPTRSEGQNTPIEVPTLSEEQNMSNDEPTGSGGQNTTPIEKPTRSEEHNQPSDEPTRSGGQNTPMEEPTQSEDQNMSKDEPTESRGQDTPSDGPTQSVRQNTPMEEPTQSEDQNMSKDEPTESKGQDTPSDGPTQSVGQNTPMEEPTQSEDQNMSKDEPTESRGQDTPSDGPTQSVRQNTPMEEPTQSEDQNMSKDEPTESRGQDTPSDGPTQSVGQNTPMEEPTQSEDQNMSKDEPTESRGQDTPSDGPTQSVGQNTPMEEPTQSEDQNMSKDEPTESRGQDTPSDGPTQSVGQNTPMEEPTQSEDQNMSKEEPSRPEWQNTPIEEPTQSEEQENTSKGSTPHKTVKGNEVLEQSTMDNSKEGISDSELNEGGIPNLATGEWITEDSVGDSDVEEESAPEVEEESAPEGELNEKEAEGTVPREDNTSDGNSQNWLMDTCEKSSSENVIPQKGDNQNVSFTGVDSTGDQLGGNPDEKNENELQDEKDDIGEEGDGFQEIESDVLMETDEPMETDEFDELERAVKEQSKKEAEEKNAEMGEESTAETTGEASEDSPNNSTKAPTESGGEKDAEQEMVQAATESEDVTDGSEAVAPQDMDAKVMSDSNDAGAEQKDQLHLTESQEMLLQYDGEDVLETMLNDSQEGKADSQEDKTDKSEGTSAVEGDVEPMEADEVPSGNDKIAQESKGAGPMKEVAENESMEPAQPKLANEEADVIDMIDAGTVYPSENEPPSAKESVENASSGTKIADGEANDAGNKTIQMEQNKDTSPASTDEKKRRSGGSSISSIVSRLTQSLADKKTEEPSTEKTPTINQVKTLSQDTPKEKLGRKQVYKKDEVFNRCSVCLNTFLSINPIKFNNNVFCSDTCLHKKKGAGSDTSICSNCKTSYKNDLQEKFTLTVGLRERGFCSQTCVGDYQKRVKPCSNCGEDIAGTNNAFMAQVGGDEGKFMEFCSQACVEAYEVKLKDQPQVAKKDSSEKKTCSMCNKITVIKHEVKFRGQYYHMCGADCFGNFRKKYNLSLRTCNQCGTTCYNEQSPGDDKEGHKVFFCSQKCLEIFQHSRSLSEPCFNCKTMYKQGMLIEGKSSNNKVYKFCSQECLRKGLPSPAAPTGRNATGVPPPQAPRVATQVQASALKPKGVKTTDTSSQGQGVIPCNHCKKPQRPLYHLTMSDSSLRNFCSYPCVIAFQAQFNVPPVTLPQETLLLKCGQCKRGFSHRPKTLDYQGETRLFCTDTCLEDFKKTQSVIAICDCCFEEKILYEETNFLGKARYFCSPGCSLIFKNQFVKRIGLRCAMCDYCSTMCKIATVSVQGGAKKRFCGEECKESYHQWYNRMARCEGCKRMGCELTESFRWRGKVKRVCNEQCLLLFYTQQNVPDMGTQLQSELTSLDKATKNGTDSSFPTITNVKSLAAGNQASEQMMVKHIPMAHKQTQITTNTIFVKPPPPPPTPPPPAPKQVKNKITLCKPYAVSKGVTCKPSSKNESTQADLKPVLVPIPIPIFIPVPMQMYTTPVPQPFPIPVPIPTPMFVPVAYSNCDKLMKVLEDIKNTIPNDPLEADILMMATAIAGKEESNRLLPSPDGPAGGNITDLLPFEDSEVVDIPVDSDIVGMLSEGLETIDSTDLFPEDRISRSLSKVTRSSTQEDSETTTRRTRSRGAKRVCLDAEDDDDDNDSPESPESTKEDVRPDIGPAAYSFYLQQISKDGVLPNDKLKANLSLASVDELHYCLCRFVKEATQPDGEMYPPDTLYLILLSIQKYLMTNNRKENIFMDPYFQTFSGFLHERLGEHSIVMNPHEEIDPGITCLDEEFLWESRQLGAHSPAVLLSTILYYTTKDLMLKTAAMHQQLAFSRVQKLVRKDSKGKREAYVRVLPSEEQRQRVAENKGKKRPLDLDFALELQVNTKQPLRCPVKLYEFYLSKCPEVVKTSRTLFYLVPERACVPDSPLWYSDKALPAKKLERYLWRHLMVKDIHEHWEMLRLKKEGGASSDSE